MLALTASAGFAGPANASHKITCDEDVEAPLFQGGEEFGVDIGPGLLYAGADIGGLLGTDIENFACVHSEALGTDLLVTFDDDSPLALAAGGCLVDVGGCRLSGIRLHVGDGDGIPTLQLALTGVTPSPVVVTVLGEGCLAAIGTTCP